PLDEQPPFTLQDFTLSIPRGMLAAVIERVGSGKTSLLQGLVDAGGKWAFGGSVAFCLQSARILNATLRDNVLFGQPFEEDRYWRIIADSCLLPALELLADGDLMEVRYALGSNKQRVNIACVLYYGVDVLSAGTPLHISHLHKQVPDREWQPAVDGNVGKALFGSVIQGLVAQGKTFLLVMHAQCDYIYMLDGGRTAEAGMYPEFIACGGEFARLDREFGGAKAEDACGRAAWGETGTRTRRRCRWCR
ncbi:P-loop containing nucleoside triphosphate hydrolase protein, partial [Mycena leptocephala]